MMPKTAFDELPRELRGIKVSAILAETEQEQLAAVAQARACAMWWRARAALEDVVLEDELKRGGLRLPLFDPGLTRSLAVEADRLAGVPFPEEKGTEEGAL